MAATEAPTPFTLTLGAGAILFFYQSLQAGAASTAAVHFAKLIADGKYGRFGFYLEPHFRDTKIRSYYDGPVWIEQAYVSLDILTGNTPLTLKAGKVYSQLGLFWDNSFWGNIHLYEGLKIAADVGVSVEGRVGREEGSGVRYWAQYFVVDGGVNYALVNHDTLTLPNSRRRNEVIGRVEPYLKLGSKAVLKPGVSAAYIRADLEGAPNDVFRGAADVTLTVGPWGLWGEYMRQQGFTTHAYPYEPVAATATTPAIAGRGSAHNNYMLVGSEFTYGPVTGRVNFSFVDYADLHVNEWMLVPGIGVKLNDYVTVMVEFDEHRKHAPEGNSVLDRSLTFSVHGNFFGKVIDRK